ncbi:MAG: hypothetical protein M3295_01775, partial [Chloroflexota bacterium]|nr:hypothetical protein [Chloroflexota bacterium]
MPMSRATHGPARAVGRAIILIAAVAASLIGRAPPRVAADASTIVISELVTGGASANDELVELYNPLDVTASLSGLELVYVTASGSSVVRRAAWADGAIRPHGHYLIANDSGIYQTIADALYTSGISATGGSIALRVVGASTAIDALGWGNATNTWLEGAPAAAPAAGGSIERLPGGMLGSTRDTNDNRSDFVGRTAPDPQNSESTPTPPTAESPAPSPSTATATASATASAPATPAVSATELPTLSPTSTVRPTATPVDTATPRPTSMATSSPSATPTPVAGPTAVAIADARLLPEGATVTIEGTALTKSDFTDGGGFVTDASGGIAVLVSGDVFARGELLRVTGELDERYHQTTLRTEKVTHVGTGTEPSDDPATTGEIGESFEAHLVRVAGEVAGAPTILASGSAYELDDGSGAVRILVGPSTAIDTTAWVPGARVSLTGVVSQRDSSGTGASGYRVLPRDGQD